MILGTVVLILILLFVLTYILTSFTGGWFAPTPKKIVEEMLDLAEVGEKDLLIDLGSGDGKVLIAAAKRQATVIGIELNPFLYLYSLIRIKLIKSSPRISIKLGNFWSMDLSKASVVFFFLPFGEAGLKNKLQIELKSDCRIVTYENNLPDWKPFKRTKSGIFLYRV